MSSYRDDTQETAVAGDATWAGLTAIVEESVRVVAALTFGLTVLHASSATAADEVIDTAIAIVTDAAIASETVLDSRRSAAVTAEQASVSERWTHALRVVHEDTAEAGDAVIDATGSAVVELATATDEVLASRYVTSIVVDSALASDVALGAASEILDETAAASEVVVDVLRAASLALETAAASDEAFGGQQSAAPVIEVGRISGAALDLLHAQDVVIEQAVIEDSDPAARGQLGQAWTANADTWAMSRYAPYSFLSLAVVDGVAYGVAGDGVYALTGGSDLISGRIETGRMDLGRGALVHPVSARIEYELDGSAEMSVTTTQSGQALTYDYALPAEAARKLTNGRFIFGRGLRGRHFSFALQLDGAHGHINDLSVNVTATKRSV